MKQQAARISVSGNTATEGRRSTAKTVVQLQQGPITIRVPFQLHKNGVRKLGMIKAATYVPDKAMVNALAKAHRALNGLSDHC